MRICERLRHKGRAVQPFDYERLVLDRFPHVGQVKCIGSNQSHSFSESPQVPPGAVYLVAAPRLEDGADLTPRLPQYVLKEIEAYLRPLVSPHVADLHAINPVYETVKVFASVVFVKGGDASYYSDDLDLAISQYLCPWLKERGSAIPIGSGQIQGYQLAKYIVDLPYVQSLASLSILHTYQNEDGWKSIWRAMDQMVWATAPWAVLVPASRHAITVADAQGPEMVRGVSSLTVGKDFVVPTRGVRKRLGAEAEDNHILVIPRSAVTAAVKD